jgi:hypothetical protein
MPSAENAILYYEAGQSLVPMAALTDSGDHKKFSSVDDLWSDESGYNPDIKPNGVLTGLVVTPAAGGANDQIDVSAGTLNLNGVVTSINAATNQACTRGITTDVCMINAITITAAGAVAVVSGTDGTVFSETRGAAGGPPFIPVDSVELSQVRLSSITAAKVTASEIKAIPNTHRETAAFPTYEIDFSRVVDGSMENAGINFNSALVLNHTGSVAKKVFAQYYIPEFAQQPKASDFKRAANSKSVSSTQIYGGTVGAVSSSLGQGGFTAYLNDGVTDAILAKDGKKIWFKFFPDRLRAPFILTQGFLGAMEQYPAGASIIAECTISSEIAGSRVAS